MKIESGVFERIEQTFVLFKNNFKEFFILYFIYYFITFLIGSIGLYLFISNSGDIINGGMDYFSILNSSYFAIGIVVFTILIILYLLLGIPLLLGLIKSIKQAINKEKIDIKENLLYGFKSIGNSFKTYWYIFAYVALIPSILFIIGGILLNLFYFLGLSEAIRNIGVGFMGLGTILFMVFAMYRGTKSMFSIYSAVSDEKYTKENFVSSINITNNNWWRIFGNFLLLGIIIGLLSSFIGGIIGLLNFNEFDYEGLFNAGVDSDNLEGVKDVMSGYLGEYSLISEFITGFLNIIMRTIGSVFLIIFTYIFYLRLKEESVNNTNNSNVLNDKEILEDKKIEL